MKNTAPPPQKNNHEGKTRRVGVELEFIGLSAEKAADLLAETLGGTPKAEDSHKYTVSVPELGNFLVELDTIYAHKNHKPYTELLEKLGLAEDLAKTVGNLSQEFVPMEIVGPPIEWPNLNCFDQITQALRTAGAKGTFGAPYYAFGCQLNPEIVAPTVAHILPMLQAFLVLEPWLREQCNNDFTRKLTSFADPFPKGYQQKVLSAEYNPSMEQFIDDYIAANPTRNRALDLLPLFAHLMPEKVKQLGDERIKPRPTYHYRLPDSPLGKPEWRVHDEWARWLKVEELAEQPQKLAELCQEHLAELQKSPFQKLRDWVGE